MHELKGAIISGLQNLGFGPSYISRFVAAAYAEEQRQFRANVSHANLRLPVGGNGFLIGLTVAPNSEALEVRLEDPESNTVCSFSKEGVLKFGKNQHAAVPNEAVQEFLARAIGRKPRCYFLEEIY